MIIGIGPRSDRSLPMSVTHWLTHDLLELMSRPCWKADYAAYADYEDYADYADYADFADYAEYAEYAE